MTSQRVPNMREVTEKRPDVPRPVSLMRDQAQAKGKIRGVDQTRVNAGELRVCHAGQRIVSGDGGAAESALVGS